MLSQGEPDPPAAEAEPRGGWCCLTKSCIPARAEEEKARCSEHCSKGANGQPSSQGPGWLHSGSDCKGVKGWAKGSLQG